MLFTFLFATVSLAVAGLASADNKKLVCYYSSWATYRNGNGKFTSLDIDTNLCTHVIYAFAGLANDYNVIVLDSWLSLDDNYGKGDFRQFMSLKSQNRDLKLLIGIGGWNEDSGRYSRMASSPNNRKIFIQSVVDFVRRYGFDGINLDWQYPTNRGGLPSDKVTFVLLLQELRAAFNQHGYVLGISAAGNPEVLERGYSMDKVTSAVDYVGLLTYDYHGSWDLRTGMNAPLYPSQKMSGVDRTMTQDYAVNLCIRNGADPKKLLLGFPTFGRTFVLSNPNQNTVGAPSHRPGNPGPYTQQDGYLGYAEIMEKFAYEHGWVQEWDDEMKVPYAHNRVEWVSYDNEDSVRIKADYVKSKGLGGGVVWSLETDDFRGISGRRNPLINAFKETLNSDTPLPNTPPTRPTSPRPVLTTPTTGVMDCKTEGSFQHPSDCTKFYVCIRRGDGFQAVVNSCPGGLAFDKSTKACNWMESVPECNL